MIIKALNPLRTPVQSKLTNSITQEMFALKCGRNEIKLKEMKTMMKKLFTTTAFVLISLMALSFTTSAHSIDYLTSNISPSANFSGSSGNFKLNSQVDPGATISYQLTIGIDTQGNTTTYPRTVTFGVTNGSTAAAVVSPSQCTFLNSSSTCTIGVTVTAPNAPGTYHVKVGATSGTGGQGGLTGGGDVQVHFTVRDLESGCTPAGTTLTVDRVCGVLHQSAPVTLKATLLPNAPNKTINFTVDGNSAGTGITDANGVATVSYNVSTLSVGDHDIVASFDGDCDYQATSGSNTLGITYGVVSFQQPINADGSSIFKSVKTIPVKILVKDANGVPVTDAQAYVFFAMYTGTVLGTETESFPLANTNNDSGNKMRLADASTGQYIFNWDTTGLVNGTYRVRIDLGEGVCGIAHTVDLSFKRK
jgi:hypothetical protein